MSAEFLAEQVCEYTLGTSQPSNKVFKKEKNDIVLTRFHMNKDLDNFILSVKSAIQKSLKDRGS